MSAMRRSAAGAGKIPGETMPSGQAPGLHANRATVVRGYVLRREDLREFRSAYNRVAVSRSTPLRRIVASPLARPPPGAAGSCGDLGPGPPLTGEPLPPWTPHPVRLRAQEPPSAVASLTACQGGLLAGQGPAVCFADGPRFIRTQGGGALTSLGSPPASSETATHGRVRRPLFSWMGVFDDASGAGRTQMPEAGPAQDRSDAQAAPSSDLFSLCSSVCTPNHAAPRHQLVEPSRLRLICGASYHSAPVG
jgi:hypothetical protein